MSRVLPQLDEYEKGLPPSVLNELDRRGAEQFIANHPEFFGSDLNSDLLLGWINARGVCFSLRNLEVAYYALLEENAFEERPPEAPAVPAAQVVERFTHAFGEDSRPLSGTHGTVLDDKTLAAKQASDDDRAARKDLNITPVVETTPEEARALVPLPQGEDKRHQNLKQIRKDRTLDVSELKRAADAERRAVNSQGGHREYTLRRLKHEQQ